MKAAVHSAELLGGFLWWKPVGGTKASAAATVAAKDAKDAATFEAAVEAAVGRGDLVPGAQASSSLWFSGLPV